MAAASWVAGRGQADFTGSWAWALLDDAVTSRRRHLRPVLGAMWPSAEADGERRWVVECLREVLQLAPHRTPEPVSSEKRSATLGSQRRWHW